MWPALVSSGSALSCSEVWLRPDPSEHGQPDELRLCPQRVWPSSTDPWHVRASFAPSWVRVYPRFLFLIPLLVLLWFDLPHSPSSTLHYTIGHLPKLQFPKFDGKNPLI